MGSVPAARASSPSPTMLSDDGAAKSSPAFRRPGRPLPSTMPATVKRTARPRIATLPRPARSASAAKRGVRAGFGVGGASGAGGVGSVPVSGTGPGGRALELDQLQGRAADAHEIAEIQRLPCTHPHAVDERPVRRSEILDRQPAVGVAADARVAARELGIFRYLALSAHRAPDDQPIGREPAALAVPSTTTSCSPARGGLLGAAPRPACPRERRPGVGHLQDRPPTLTTSPRSSVRGASMRSPLTNVPYADPRSSIVSRPSASRRARAWRRDSTGRRRASPPRSSRGRGAGSASTVRRWPRALPSVTRSCSPAIAREPTRSRGVSARAGSLLRLPACARVRAAARSRPIGRASAPHAGWRSLPATPAPRISGRSSLSCSATSSIRRALGEPLDPEALRQVITRYFEAMREAFERHGGSVEKFIGDAVMAVFGVPTVREDDALRALRAAADMPTALAVLNDSSNCGGVSRLRIRTGVNTGEVIAGDRARGHSFATGDAVNVAARLEQAAPPGEILIGEHTLALVRDAVNVEPVPRWTSRGRASRCQAFRLVDVAEHAAAVDPRLDSPLVGREPELAQLRAALDRTIAERACEMVTLVGTAGIGKSRLAEEFAGALRGGPGRHRPVSVVRSGPHLLAAARGRRGARGQRRRESADAVMAKIARLLSAEPRGGLRRRARGRRLGLSDATAYPRRPSGPSGSSWRPPPTRDRSSSSSRTSTGPSPPSSS